MPSLRHAVMPREFGIVPEPGSARSPKDSALRSGARIVIQGACRYYHSRSISRQMRNFGTAIGAELQAESLSFRQIVALYGAFTLCPTEVFRFCEAVCSVGRAGRFAAARTVTINKPHKRNFDLITNRFAQTAPMYLHLDQLRNLQNQIIIGWKRSAIKKFPSKRPVQREIAARRNRLSICDLKIPPNALNPHDPERLSPFRPRGCGVAPRQRRCAPWGNRRSR